MSKVDSTSSKYVGGAIPIHKSSLSMMATHIMHPVGSNPRLPCFTWNSFTCRSMHRVSLKPVLPTDCGINIWSPISSPTIIRKSRYALLHEYAYRPSSIRALSLASILRFTLLCSKLMAVLSSPLSYIVFRRRRSIVYSGRSSYRFIVGSSSGASHTDAYTTCWFNESSSSSTSTTPSTSMMPLSGKSNPPSSLLEKVRKKKRKCHKVPGVVITALDVLTCPCPPCLDRHTCCP